MFSAVSATSALVASSSIDLNYAIVATDILTNAISWLDSLSVLTQASASLFLPPIISLTQLRVTSVTADDFMLPSVISHI